MFESTRSLVVVDYGSGNLRSVWQAAVHAAQDTDWNVSLSSDAAAIASANRIVLPGQGAMQDCMRELQQSHLLDVVLRAAESKPLFGVCVGMQMLLDHSEEGNVQSLGLIGGKVRRFELDGQLQPDGSRYKIPQMGWNRVYRSASAIDHPMWKHIDDGSWFYFVHSYYAELADQAHCAGETEYGAKFASAIARDNLFATQFHPEKSAEQGIALYRNFLNWNV